MAFPSLDEYKRYVEKNGTTSAAPLENAEAIVIASIPHNETVGYVSTKVQNAYKTLSKEPAGNALKDVSAFELNDISVNLLKAERAILNTYVALEIQEKEKPYGNPDDITMIPKDFCHALRPEHAIIEVRFPTFLPPYRYEWYSRKLKQKNPADQYYLDAEFDFITEAALLKNIHDDGPVWVPDEELFLVFRRSVEAKSARLVDNNNVYTGAITNAICRVLKHGDGWKALSFVYTALLTNEEPHLSVILCQKKDLMNWI